MDLVIAGLFSVGSIYSLALDYKSRKKFHTFLLEKKIGDHFLIEGVVNSAKPLKSSLYNGEGKEELLVKEVTQCAPQTDTFYANETIYESGETKIKMPIARTYKSWNTIFTDTNVADNMILNDNGKMIELFIDKNTKYYPDTNNFIIADNKLKISESSIKNNRLYSVFGKYKGQNFNVQYMGNDKDVIDNVKYDYFGVSDWKTLLACCGLVFGTLYLMRDNRFDLFK